MIILYIQYLLLLILELFVHATVTYNYLTLPIILYHCSSQVITMMIFAILVGILYLQTNRREFNRQTVVTDRIGALFFIVLNTVFGNLSAIEVFIRQKAIFV